MWEDEHRPITDRNDFTDDTDQMLLMLQSLQQTRDGILHPVNFAQRLTEWGDYGIIEIGADPGRGLGYTVGRVMNHRDFSTNPHRAAFEVRFADVVTVPFWRNVFFTNLCSCTHECLPFCVSMIGLGLGRSRVGPQWRGYAHSSSWN